MSWYQIITGYYCAAIETAIDKKGVERVTEAAPIARWMMCKDIGTVRRWVTRKGGKIVQLSDA